MLTLLINTIKLLRINKLMPNDYIISHENGITKVKFLVQPSLDLAKQIIDEIVDKYPYDKRLWDISNVKFDFTLTEIQTIAEYGKLKFISPSKIAIFAVDDLAFGEMRQFGVYREEEGKTLPQVFRNEQDAIDWLNS